MGVCAYVWASRMYVCMYGMYDWDGVYEGEERREREGEGEDMDRECCSTVWDDIYSIRLSTTHHSREKKNNVQ